MKNNIAKKYFILIALICISPISFGQNRNPAHKIVADNCKYSITYNYRFIRDTVSKQYLFDRQVLEVGEKMSKYHSVYANKMDSIAFFVPPPEAKKSKNPHADGVAPREFEKEAGLDINARGSSQIIYSNFEEKNINVSTIFRRKNYIYNEPTPVFEWKIQADTTTILGYKCMKATTTFRGRNYIAWFSPFLPIRLGPWKFGGLPGLILKISDTKDFFEWTAIGMEEPQNENIYTYKFVKGTTIESNRKDITRLLHKRWLDPVGLIQADFPPNFNGAYMISDSQGKKYTINKNGASGHFRYNYVPIPELDIDNYEKTKSK